ncbi:hypothetical protein BH11PLA2_BH11PLA2_33570 [soil metagenome]
MTPDVVVDIGNSRIKWRRYRTHNLFDNGSMPTLQPAAWEFPFESGSSRPGHCLIAGVVPAAVQMFREYMSNGGIDCKVLTNATLLKHAVNFRTEIRNPDRIGIDRLLGCVAAIRNADESYPAAAAVSVGTAVTIDFIKPDGTHVGGAILPGWDLMADALNTRTAQLPKIALEQSVSQRIAGLDTAEAISLGIESAIHGAVDRLVSRWAHASGPMTVTVSGGGSQLFEGDNSLFRSESILTMLCDSLALDGMAILAESLP